MQCLGDLFLGLSRITAMLHHVGACREAMRGYMKEDLLVGGLVMFDGHRLISRSGTLEYARVGYDSKCHSLPQVNLLYMFSVEGTRKLPVFYKQYREVVLDASAFSDIVSDAGLRRRNVTVIADKGFESELNEAMLDDASLGYILAVRRGCAGIPEIPSSPDKYQKVFKFRERAIYCNECRLERGRFFLYYDMELANDEAVDFITRKEKTNNTIAKGARPRNAGGGKTKGASSRRNTSVLCQSMSRRSCRRIMTTARSS